MCITTNAKIFPLSYYPFSSIISHICRLGKHKNLPLGRILIFPMIPIDTKTKKEIENNAFILVSLFIIVDIRANNCFLFNFLIGSMNGLMDL